MTVMPNEPSFFSESMRPLKKSDCTEILIYIGRIEQIVADIKEEAKNGKSE